MPPGGAPFVTPARIDCHDAVLPIGRITCLLPVLVTKRQNCGAAPIGIDGSTKPLLPGGTRTNPACGPFWPLPSIPSVICEFCGAEGNTWAVDGSASSSASDAAKIIFDMSLIPSKADFISQQWGRYGA
jgi:hypothetical protein